MDQYARLFYAGPVLFCQRDRDRDDNKKAAGRRPGGRSRMSSLVYLASIAFTEQPNLSKPQS